MELQNGQKLLHYELAEKIGEGGMGVVWKARDTTLDRDVAIKILPAGIAAEPERLARFEREARILAALDHPNIASVYGLHEADGQRFIAMEFVPGEDLAERLERGPLPVEDALDIAGQVAAGLEAAHDQGVIHRDLKPANIKCAPDGRVKVLDLGLAKALVHETSGGAVSASLSPTVTSAGTIAGTLLGTAAYMSPEQARGKSVDRRADVWAFGCVLYECLTGKRAFPGDTISDILAEVIKSEPDWEALPAVTPLSVHRLLRRCLAKSPGSRLRNLGDAALELDEAAVDEAEVAEATAGPMKTRIAPRMVVFYAIAAFVLGMIGGIAWERSNSGVETTSASTSRIAGLVDLPADATIAYGSAAIGYDSPMLSISGDGRHLVYVGRDGDGSRLYRRDLTTFDPPDPIPGTEGALQAVFAPSELAIAFYTNDKVGRVDLSGDRLQVFGEVRSATRIVWADDGWIYVGNSQASVLQRYPEGGGDPEDLGKFPNHGFTDVGPGGAYVLFHEKQRSLTNEFGTVSLHDFLSGERRLVLDRAYGAVIRGERLYFIRDASLVYVPFDATAGEVTGDTTIVVRDIATESIFGQAQFALSAAGTLAYLPGGDRAIGTIAWVDRDGNRGTLPVEPQIYGTLDLAPDDRRIAVHVGDVRDYVWIYDIEHETGRKLPSSLPAGWPNWKNTENAVSYTEMGETTRIVEQRVDARGEPRVLVETSATGTRWSPDDSVLSFGRNFVSNFLDADGKQVIEPFPGFMSYFSRDGKWLAYGTQQTGVYETVVRSWPDGDEVYSIQAEGGVETIWAPNNEMFYRLGDRWYVVQTTTGDSFTASEPELAFEIAFLDTPGFSYDVTSDGQRMYTIVQAEEDVVDRIHVVTGLD